MSCNFPSFISQDLIVSVAQEETNDESKETQGIQKGTFLVC